MIADHFISRLERFESVDSTQRVVREWMESGTPEVAVAVADVQTEGRGRQGRTWTAPPGAALLVSCGLTPTFLHVSRGWQLAATASLAMLDAAEDVAGLPDDTLGLKWPNDLVAEASEGRLVKLAGVLGETAVRSDRMTFSVIGLGVNTAWRRSDFPDELADNMTSLLEVSGGRPVDRDGLLDAFLSRLEPRYEALRGGRFDAGGWSRRQRQTDRLVEVLAGGRTIAGRADGVDSNTGALLVHTTAGLVAVDSGEVVRCRVVD